MQRYKKYLAPPNYLAEYFHAIILYIVCNNFGTVIPKTKAAHLLSGVWAADKALLEIQFNTKVTFKELPVMGGVNCVTRLWSNQCFCFSKNTSRVNHS